ncbi:MAG TPA: HlyD family efflux transporter periplasmic adaptor subunit [Rhodobacteraceae bacterium]|nr:HlyD family efflux transporter periplasmic adaptor subunit [Paracoccaceae bacterium]
MRFLGRSLVGLFLLSLTVGILALAGNTFYSALKDSWAREAKVKPRRERVFAVNVVTAKARSIVPEMTSFGEIRSQRVLDLRATAKGPVVELAKGFVDGGAVRAGDLLVRIDPRDAQAALARAQGDLAEARAEADEANAALLLAQDELKAAEGQAKLRLRALQRQKDLRNRKVGTDAAVEAAELAEAAARQAVLSRRQAVQQAKARITRAATRLTLQKVNLEEAERRLQDTAIYAAFDGILDQVNVVPGAVVAPNERLARLIDDKALEVSFRLSTSQYARLLDENGNLDNAPVKVVLDVFGVDLVAKGHISRESAEVGEGQTGRQLYATLDAAKGFKPGDFVTVRIAEPELQDVIVLPAAAVDAAGTVLLVGKEDRLEQVQVDLLRRQGDDVILRAPEIIGRQVVTARTPLLGQGIKVRPLLAEEAAANQPELLELSEERRARLIAFVKASKHMPDEAKARVLAQLARDRVPARTVLRIEARMGG